MTTSNPFGRLELPRNLDNERLFTSWFQVADEGARIIKMCQEAGSGKQGYELGCGGVCACRSLRLVSTIAGIDQLGLLHPSFRADVRRKYASGCHRDTFTSLWSGVPHFEGVLATGRLQLTA